MSPAALLLALAVAAPTLWATLVTGTVPVDVALQRLLLILIGTAVAWNFVERLISGFARSSAVRRQPARRRDDLAEQA